MTIRSSDHKPLLDLDDETGRNRSYSAKGLWSDDRIFTVNIPQLLLKILFLDSLFLKNFNSTRSNKNFDRENP